MIRSGNDSKPERVVIAESKATLVRPRPKGWVSLNSGATGLFRYYLLTNICLFDTSTDNVLQRAKYSRALEDELLEAIRSNQLPVEERLSILLDVRQAYVEKENLYASYRRMHSSLTAGQRRRMSISFASLRPTRLRCGST